MKKSLSQIKSDLYELLADKTLEFGCKFEALDGCIYTVCSVSGGYYKTIMVAESLNYFAMEGIVNIIGREPTFGEVWNAMREECDSLDNCYGGSSVEFTSLDGTTATYDSKISFDNQEEETYRELHKLLITKT